MPRFSVYAHSLPDQPQERWEPLAEHLEKVADLAGRFASAFHSREWGKLAGWWHDLRKYKPAFQARLRGSREKHAETTLASRNTQMSSTLCYALLSTQREQGGA